MARLKQAKGNPNPNLTTDPFLASQDKLSTVYTDAYALTNSGIDLVARGMMRSMSQDPRYCHSCMKAYKQVFFAVLSMEQIYYNWQDMGRGVDGSYFIFKHIVNIYERLDFIDLQCGQQEIWASMRNRLTMNDRSWPAHLDVLELIDDFLLMWYGFWWT